MKVHIVTEANRSLYAKELLAMHRMRYEVFVEKLSWEQGIIVDNRREYDRYDNSRGTVYLLACQGGQVFGSFRMLATWRHSMIDDLWSEFVASGEQVARPDVWELSRLCIDPGIPKVLQQQVKLALFQATLEFGASRQASGFVALAHVRHLAMLEEFGWAPEPLGPPRVIGPDPCMVFRWDATDDLMERTREIIGFETFVTIEAWPTSHNLGQPEMIEQLYEIDNGEDAAAVSGILSRILAKPRPVNRIDALPVGRA